MAKARAGGANYTENKNITSILTVIEEDCFTHFSRSKSEFIQLSSHKAQKRESLVEEWEYVA
jgi:hypothetical protein